MDYDNVIGMITNTRLKDWESVLSCMEMYIDGGYWEEYAERKNDILAIVWDMWHYKPFYQPRLEHGFVLVGEPNTLSPCRINFFRDIIWIQAEEDPNSPWHTQEAALERIANGDRTVLGISNQEEEE